MDGAGVNTSSTSQELGELRLHKGSESQLLPLKIGIIVSII